MAYTIFALKWRPNNFDEVVGQAHVTLTLKNAIQKDRLANAYLFSGPRGVGKTSTARILAKALNCKEGPTVMPCGKCVNCVEISQGRSFDVIEIDGASNRGIDEVRVLRENIKFAPTASKFKVYIIDEVHMLTQEAFNALLKTLEEPPEFVKFIFATTQPQKVISTVLSRCQRFDFRRISIMETIAQLQKITAAENIEVDKEVMFAIAKASDGSLRDAESILDQLISFSKGKISIKDVISVLGLVEQEALFAITDRIAHKETKAVLELLNNIIDEGKDPGVFLINLIEHFRNLMLAKITHADSKIIDLPQDICEGLLKQAQDFSLEEIFTAFNILVNTQEMAKRLDSMRIPLEVNLVRLVHEKRDKISSAHVRPASNKENVPIQPAKNEEVVKEPANPAIGISLDNITGAWQNIVEAVSRVKMSAGTYLSEGKPVRLEKSILNVSFPRDYSLHKESLERRENKALIEKTVSELLHANIRVNFILSQEATSKENNIDNTVIKSALNTFNGRVVKEEQ